MVEKLNLAQLVEKQKDNESLALSGATGDISYRQLFQKIGTARRTLQGRGVKAGDRVALMMPNIPAMPIYYYAIISLGAVAVPLNPLLSASEVNFQMQDSGSSLLIAWDGARIIVEEESFEDFEVLTISAHDQLEQNPEPWISEETAASDPAVILYTSGTTGHSKGAILTHRNLWSNATTVAKVFEYTDRDVFFGGLPLFHSFGQTVSLNAAFAAGATVALLPRFSPDAAVQLCADANVTIIAAVPSMYTAIAAYLEKNPCGQLRGALRYGISGGSPLAASTHADFDRLLECQVLEGYGLSETSPVVSFNQPKYEPVIGSVGRAIDGVQVQVRGEDGAVLPVGERGELWVSGPSVMAGYWNQPEATAAVMDGEWLATGDVAQLDADGNIFIVDRIKDMILRNGYSVYPREIEDVIYRHVGVRMVAVVGKPDERVGEEIYALIVPRDEEELNNPHKLIRDIDNLCRSELAKYKYPRNIQLVKTLPLGPTGKILKKDLR